MADKLKVVEVPFGAQDSELQEWKYNVPKGYTAEVKDGVVIIKKSESEDERIRKWLYGYFSKIGGKNWIYPGITCEEVLAWLEKQKEQKPKTVGEYHTAFNELYGDYEPNLQPIEQKPVEYLNKDKIYAIMSKLTNLSLSPLIPINSDEYKKLHEITSDVRSLLDYPTEQKPVEWSEVELKFRGEKVKVKRPFFRDDKGRGYSTTEQDEDVAWYALRAWCEKKGISLYDLYPKVEWSEKDEEMLNRCISSIDEAKENRYAYKETDGDTSYDEEMNFLKSLRPQPKQEWSEEDERNIRDTIVAVEAFYAEGCGQEELVDWLKSKLRPQKKEDLPKWRKMPPGYEIRPANVCSIAVDVLDVNGKYVGQMGRTVLQNGNEYLFLDDLEKLPKEDEK